MRRHFYRSVILVPALRGVSLRDPPTDIRGPSAALALSCSFAAGKSLREAGADEQAAVLLPGDLEFR